MPILSTSRLAQAFDLWTLTGWNEGYKVSHPEFEQSWQASALRLGIVEDERLVAIGRANTDGVLYAMIYDIVVHPDARGRGLGTRMVKELLAELQAMKVRCIQLMAAKGQAEFYRRLGFVIRPEDGPGMQYLGPPA